MENAWGLRGSVRQCNAKLTDGLEPVHLNPVGIEGIEEGDTYIVQIDILHLITESS